MRKWMIILLALAVAAIGAPSANAAKSDTITVALTGEPPTMDPHATSNFIGAMVWRWSYDSLVSAETGTGRIVPWLAEKWAKVTPKAVKFRLRKGVKFPDGTPLTSEAVKVALERVLKSPRQRPYFKAFNRIEIIDDHTFIWHNNVPENGMFHRLTRWAHPINPKVRGLDKATVSRNTFGTGPYILKSWTKGQKMVFEANPTWWGNSTYPDRPKRIVLRRIRESATRVKALLTGEVDVITGVMPQFIPQIEKDPHTAVAAVPAVRILFMGFFTKFGGPLANVKVRKAINYAIDAEIIRKTILGGRADPIGQLLHPWNYSGYNPNKKWYGYDPGRAKQLLKEAGFPNGFKAELIATNGRYPGDKATCEATAGMLKKVGLDVRCNSQRFPLYKKVFQAYRKGKKKTPAMYFMGFGNGAGDAGLVLTGTTGCKGFWSGHCFKEIDAAIADAVGEPDPKKQQAKFEKVTNLMKEKVTHKIYYKIHDVFGYNNRLKFTPRHDETLYPWEIVVKPTG